MAPSPRNAITTAPICSTRCTTCQPNTLHTPEGVEAADASDGHEEAALFSRDWIPRAAERLKKGKLVYSKHPSKSRLSWNVPHSTHTTPVALAALAAATLLQKVGVAFARAAAAAHTQQGLLWSSQSARYRQRGGGGAWRGQRDGREQGWAGWGGGEEGWSDGMEGKAHAHVA